MTAGHHPAGDHDAAAAESPARAGKPAKQSAACGQNSGPVHYQHPAAAATTAAAAVLSAPAGGPADPASSPSLPGKPPLWPAGHWQGRRH